MIVSVESMTKLQHALGASGDTKAEGLVRLASERLEGPREYFLGDRDGRFSGAFSARGQLLKWARRLVRELTKKPRRKR